MDSKYFRVCADIDLSAIRENIKNISKGLKPNTKICCVIKADGYGHGAVEIAESANALADFFAVATLEEALELRDAGVKKPILILGYIHPGGNEAAIEHDIRMTVFDYDTAILVSEAAVKAGKSAKIHIKTDTGMSRVGLRPDDESLDIIKRIKALPGIEIEGMFTHLYASDSADLTSAYGQLKAFTDFNDRLKDCDINIPIVHCANSAAAVNMREADLDMVRLGIVQYGLYPSEFVRQIRLIPAMTLKSHVVMVKTIPEGTSVGYGGTYTARSDVRVATIPVGYADGYMRTLSNRGYVLIKGMKAPVIGRVCMDQFMVDVSDIPDVKVGDEAVLIGRSGNEVITMEEISELAGSFNYEFACDISKRVPRRYFLDSEIVSVRDYLRD